MKLSPEGLEFITREEGCRLTAYRDVAGVLTIGVGHTGPDVSTGVTITMARAHELLAKDVARFEAAVDKAILGPHLTQNQFDAMVSLAFNIGAAAFAGSALARKYNSGDVHGAAQQFVVWNRAGGEYNPGLLGRRAREMTVFLVGH